MKTMSLSTRLAAAMLLGVAQLAAATEITTDPAEQVRQAEIGFARALEGRDREAFAGYLAPDARFFGGPRVHVGPDEILEAWQAYFREDGPRLSWEPAKVEVNEDRGLAVSTGPYTLKTPATAEAKAQTLHGTFFSVWRRTEAGDWKVIFDTGTSPQAAVIGSEEQQ